MPINRGFDNSRQIARESIESLKTDRPIDPRLAADLSTYVRISREHYTGGRDKINLVRTAYRTIEKKFPFQAEELIAEYCNAEVRRDIMRDQSHQQF